VPRRWMPGPEYHRYLKDKHIESVLEEMRSHPVEAPKQAEPQPPAPVVHHGWWCLKDNEWVIGAGQTYIRNGKVHHMGCGGECERRVLDDQG